MGVRGPPGAWALGPGPRRVAAAASNLYGRDALFALAPVTTAQTVVAYGDGVLLLVTTQHPLTVVLRLTHGAGH